MSVLYAFKTDHCREVDDWIKATKERAKDDSMIKNPFKWRIKQRTKKGKSILIVEVTVLFPNLTIFGWITGAMVLMVWGATKWIIPCLVLGCLGIFWTSEFFFLMNKKALRKAGYLGEIKRLKYGQVIREVIL